MKRIREPIPSELKIQLNGEDEWKKVLQILEDDGYMWVSGYKPTKWRSESYNIVSLKDKLIYTTSDENDIISDQSFIDTYSEKILYEVDDVVVVTENMGGDPVGVITKVIRVQSDGNVWLKAVTRDMFTGWYHSPDSIRIATEDEIRTYEQSQKPVDEKIKVGDYIIGRDGYVPKEVCKVYEIKGEYYKYIYPNGGKSQCVLRYIRKATQEEVEKYYPPKTVDNRTKLPFKSEDGYDLYDGDIVQWVNDRNQLTNPAVITKMHERIDIKTWKIFHSKENAERYIEEQNRPKEPVYKVGDWVTITGGYGNKENGNTYMLSGHDGCHWYIIGSKLYPYSNMYLDIGKFRPATPEEITIATGNSTVKQKTKDEWKVGDVLPAQWLSGIKRFRSWCGIANIAGNVVNDVEVKIVKKGWACISVEKDIWLAPKSEYSTYQSNSTVKEEKPTDIVWKVGNQVKIQSIYTITKVTDTHIHLESVSWPIEEANDHIRRGIWTMIEKEDTSTVKESIPVERRWKIGDKFKTRGDIQSIYTIENSPNGDYRITWDSEYRYGYTGKEIDNYLALGTWILYNPEPIPVTADSSESPIVVGDTVEVKIDGEIGTVITVDDRETTMPYEVKILNKGTWWLTKEQVKKVTTNQQSQTKIKENEKHNQTSSTNNQQCISKQQDNEEVITYIRANSTVIEGPRISTGEAVTATYKIKPQVIEK